MNPTQYLYVYLLLPQLTISRTARFKTKITVQSIKRYVNMQYSFNKQEKIKRKLYPPSVQQKYSK